MMKKKSKIRFVTKKNLEENFLEKKIFSALCAIFFSDTVYNFSEDELKNNFIFWPDGLSAKLVNSKLQSEPGRYMLLKLIEICKKRNLKITFAGSDIDFSNSIFKNLNYNFIELPFCDHKALSKKILADNLGDILILCISSPKQELTASTLLDNANVPIYCFGAAVFMLTGSEVIAPKFMEKLRLEGLWRIMTGDTKRRLGHLKRFPKGYKIFSRFT